MKDKFAKGKNIVYKSSLFVEGNIHIGDVYSIANKEIQIPLDLNSIPFVNQADFAGRINQLEDLKKLLTEDKNSIINVNGISGIGKTSFLKKFLTKNRNELNYTCWLQGQKDIRLSFLSNIQLIDSLNLREEIGKIDKNANWIQQSFELLINRMRSLEKGNKDLVNLLVIDNVNHTNRDFNKIFKFIALKPNWKVIITSREKIAKTFDFFLDSLNLNESKSLFKLYYSLPIDDSDLNKIVKGLHFHPYLIELTSKNSYEKFYEAGRILELLNINNLSFFESPKKKIEISLNNIFENFDLYTLSTIQSKLLILFSVLPVGNISGLNKSPENLRNLLNVNNENEDLIFRTLKELSNKGLLKYDGEHFAYSIHDLIRTLFLDLYSPTYTICEQLVDFLNEKLKLPKGKNPIELLNWIKYGESIFTKIQQNHSEIGYIGTRIGNFYETLSQYQLANKYHETALSIATEVKNIKLSNWIKSNFALSKRNEGKFDEASYLLQEAINNTNDSKDLHELSSLKSNLGIVKRYQGKYQEAKKLIEESIELDKIATPNNQGKYLIRISMLGNIYTDLGEYEKSIELNEEALQISENLYGKDNLANIFRIISLSNGYFHSGRIMETLRMSNKGIELLRLINGENLEANVIIKTTMGHCHAYLHDYEMAEKYYNEALHLYQELELNNHRLVHLYGGLALLYKNKKDFRKAQNYCEKGLEQAIHFYGINHIETIKAFNNLGEVFLLKNNKAEALIAFQQGYSIANLVLDKKHPYFRGIKEKIDKINQGA